jgi:hypothetical protein
MATSSLLVALALAALPAAEAPPAPEARPAAVVPAQGNLLLGPARLLVRYLEAVRLAGPRAIDLAGAHPGGPASAYAEVRRLMAPRTLAEIARRETRGEDHPLAFWHGAARARVLEGFQLVSIRRAGRGAVVASVEEREWTGTPEDGAVSQRVSEYLVAPVGGEWRVVDRRPGGAFDEGDVDAYDGFWDPQGAPAR